MPVFVLLTETRLDEEVMATVSRHDGGQLAQLLVIVVKARPAAQSSILEAYSQNTLLKLSPTSVGVHLVHSHQGDGSVTRNPGLFSISPPHIL